MSVPIALRGRSVPRSHSHRAASSRNRRRRPALEALEDRLAPAGILNANFAISDPTSPNYGWTTRGGATIANGLGILNERTTVQTEFSQTFTIPAGTSTLGFTIVASNLVSNGPSNPPDAFEAALLNASTLQPLVGPPTGLGNTDAFLNIQQTGQVYYAPQVTVPGAGASGAVASLNYPVQVSVDISSVPANTQATLFFDLIGFPPATSSVEIANVTPAATILSPTANAQSVSTAEGASLPVTLTATDPNTPPLPLSYTVTTSPQHGTLSGTAPKLTYTPGNGYFGPDSFAFKANNGTLDSNVAKVSITVIGQPTATAQTITVAQGTPQAIVLKGSDPNSPPLPLTFSVTTQPGHGTLSGTAPNLAYTPTPGYLGPDSFQYKANNGTLDSAPASITLNVGAPPIANSRSINLLQGTPTAITLTGSDPNSPPMTLTYTVTTEPAHGTLSGTAPNLTYTPTAGYLGPDSFQFTTSNSIATSPTATIALGVVGPPSAHAQSINVAQASSTAITLTGSDPNSPPLPLTFSVSTDPAHGTLSGTAPNLTYTPTSGYFGPDSFQFVSSNGVGTSSPVSVAILVVAPPTASAQSITTAPGTPVAITLTGSDPNTPPLPLTYVVTASPISGALSGTAPNLTYTPSSGFSGSDSFQFKVNNGTLDSSIATVAVTVTSAAQPPISRDDSYSTMQNLPLTVAAPGVLANDSSPGITPTAVLVSGPAHGSLQLNPDGSFTYTPNANYTGQDSYTYRAVAGGLPGNVATVHLTITPCPTRLFPDNTYYNYLRERRSLDPARFDSYHPILGTLLGLEISGLPSRPTLLVPPNHHFNVAASRAQYAQNPQQFLAANPVLGALFALESPPDGPAPTHLLPLTPQLNAARALYEQNPAQFDRTQGELGGVFAIEDIENGCRSTVALNPTSGSAPVLMIGHNHPGRLGNAPNGHTSVPLALKLKSFAGGLR